MTTTDIIIDWIKSFFTVLLALGILIVFLIITTALSFGILYMAAEHKAIFYCVLSVIIAAATCVLKYTINK